MTQISLSKEQRETEEQLVLDHYKLVAAHARNFRNTNVTDVDDYIQAGLIALIKANRQFDADKGEWPAYVSVSIRREIAREFSRFTHILTKPLIEDTVEDDTIEILHEFFPKSLTTQERKIIKNRLEGRSLREIGESMGYSHEYINQLLHKAYKKIKEANFDE